MDGPSSPLFPFGFGLSYSSFEVGELRLRSLGARASPLVARAYLHVRNSGSVAAAQVVQCYARDPIQRHARRWRRLVGFERIELAADASLLVEVRAPRVNGRNESCNGRDIPAARYCMALACFLVTCSRSHWRTSLRSLRLLSPHVSGGADGGGDGAA